MALKDQGPGRLNPGPRDKDALLAIYQTGIIAAGHLVRLFWQGKSYGYLRLRMLARGGFVETISFHEAMPGRKRKKRKLTSFYSLTGRGIEAIAGMLDESPRPPWKNRPPPERYYEFWHMGELWCRLVEEKALDSTRDWVPSRQAKKLLRLPAYAPLHALLLLEKEAEGYKEAVALYYLRRDASTKRINMLKNFLPRVDAAGAKKHFIVCADMMVLSQVIKIFLRSFPERNIYALAFEDARETLAEYLRDSSVFYRELSARLKRFHGGNLVFMPAGPLEAGEYYFEDSGRRMLVTELISGNLAAFARILDRGMRMPPERLYLYIPKIAYYHRIKHLLPAERNWLGLVVKNREPGDDIFRAT